MSIGAAAGLGVTVYLSLKAKPKVDEAVAETKEEIKGILNENGCDEDTMTETVKKEVRAAKIRCAKKVGKVVAGPVLTALATLGLIFGSNAVNTKRISEATALYEISNNAQKIYKEAAKEVVGDKKAEEISEKAATKRIEQTYDSDDVIETGKGNVIYVDEWTGTYIRTSRNAIDAAVNVINNKLITEMYMSAWDFFYELGVPTHKIPKITKSYGWNFDDGPMYINYVVGERPDGENCIMISYNISKRYSYSNRSDD